MSSWLNQAHDCLPAVATYITLITYIDHVAVVPPIGDMPLHFASVLEIDCACHLINVFTMS